MSCVVTCAWLCRRVASVCDDSADPVAVNYGCVNTLKYTTQHTSRVVGPGVLSHAGNLFTPNSARIPRARFPSVGVWPEIGRKIAVHRNMCAAVVERHTTTHREMCVARQDNYVESKADYFRRTELVQRTARASRISTYAPQQQHSNGPIYHRR